MIKSYTFAADQPGPHVLFFGAVHGNEVCGPKAIERVLHELDSGALKLTRGKIEFVPICNPKAYAADQRCIDRNLNRYFVPSEQPKVYEDYLTNILAKMLENCDWFIDLHSTTAGGIPFASIEGDDPEEGALAAALGAQVLLYGWHEAYEASGRVNPDPHESMGTTAYARSHGAKGVLLECGQHKADVSIDAAYHAIHNALRHIGMSEDKVTVPAVAKPRIIRTTRVVFRGQGGTFTEKWGNFSTVKAGQHLATHADGEQVIAPQDGFIILPHADTPQGTEWFYFGVEDL
jgi:predicted deacylase